MCWQQQTSRTGSFPRDAQRVRYLLQDVAELGVCWLSTHRASGSEPTGAPVAKERGEGPTVCDTTSALC
eukprot:1850389-Rhodomonas_salina.12